MSLATRESGELHSGPGLPLGPESLTWHLFADGRTLLLGPRAVVLQNMLPALGQGVQDHSVFFADTAARLARTVPPIFNTVYAADPVAAGRQVRDFHTSIKGKLPASMGGRHYSALNPDTYYWAHATFVEHMIVAADRFIRPLGEADRDRIIGESVTWFERYGVSSRGIPTTWAEFDAYFQKRIDQELVRHRTAAYGVGYATKGWPRPRRIPRPVWWLLRSPVNAVSSFLTIGGLPPRAREILGLPWDDVRERRYRRFARVVRVLDPLIGRLPPRFRLHPIAARAFAREASG